MRAATEGLELGVDRNASMHLLGNAALALAKSAAKVMVARGKKVVDPELGREADVLAILVGERRHRVQRAKRARRAS